MSDQDRLTPWNPSEKAIARVKNPLPVPTICDRCGGDVRVVTHKELYHGREYGNWPWSYQCGGCKAYIGIHPETNIPLGTLADKTLRSARNRAKQPFEQIWRLQFLTRKEAYRWLAAQMGLTSDTCHFGWFDVRQCDEAYSICSHYLEQRKAEGSR